MKKTIYFLLPLLIAPLFSFASVTDIFKFQGLLYSLLSKLNYLFWLLAILVFFWGVVKFIANAADPGEREKGKHLMVWGVISFTVLFSIWAIVRLIVGNTFGIASSDIKFIDKNGTPVF